MMTKSAMTRQQRIDVLTKRDGYLCFMPFCMKPFTSDDEITFDHWWIPQSLGGTWEIDNLRMAHKRCNAIKGDRVPSPDGTLPILPRELRPAAVDKSLRVPVCDLCQSGRLLLEGEICELCGSDPQPRTAPKYMQVPISKCDHDVTFCGYCYIGLIPRKSALEHLLTGP